MAFLTIATSGGQRQEIRLVQAGSRLENVRTVAPRCLRVPETQFCRFSRRDLVFVNEPSEHVAAPKTVEGDDGL